MDRCGAALSFILSLLRRAGTNGFKILLAAHCSTHLQPIKEDVTNRERSPLAPVPSDTRKRQDTRNAGVRSRIANGVDYSPDFPLAAATWRAQVKKATGITVDGAIALDPFAVAAVLRGSPPIRVSVLPTPVTAGV